MKPLFPLDTLKEEAKTSQKTEELQSPESILGTIGSCWELLITEFRATTPVLRLHEILSPLVFLSESVEEIILIKPKNYSFQEAIEGLFSSTKKKMGLDFLSLSFQEESSDKNSDISSDKSQKESQKENQAFSSFDNGNKKIQENLSLKHKRLPQDPPSEENQVYKTEAEASKLNPNYTFQNFVKGPSNQFALATCLSVAERPGQNYNPLFLYGSTGLGKTHLLHAVGNKVLSQNSAAIVTYISSERFMNEMIFCIRHNKMWDFRNKYRNCDVFMMDDIQFISGNKSATQEEFFHTFNTLYEAKKQIIITSDLFPQDIPDIEERLRNRFQWGLIADIQPPDTEHRIAILMNKAEKLGIKLSYDAAEYIANHAKRNVRELEGALHRIAAFGALHGRKLDQALAMETFQNMAQDHHKKLDIEVVQRTVADYYKLRICDLKSKSRQRVLALPRQIAMFLTRQFTTASYPEIGERFGGKDHSTIIHAFQKITLEKERSPELRSQIESLERRLEQL